MSIHNNVDNNSLNTGLEGSFFGDNPVASTIPGLAQEVIDQAVENRGSKTINSERVDTQIPPSSPSFMSKVWDIFIFIVLIPKNAVLRISHDIGSLFSSLINREDKAVKKEEKKRLKKQQEAFETQASVSKWRQKAWNEAREKEKRTHR